MCSELGIYCFSRAGVQIPAKQYYFESRPVRGEMVRGLYLGVFACTLLAIQSWNSCAQPVVASPSNSSLDAFRETLERAWTAVNYAQELVLALRQSEDPPSPPIFTFDSLQELATRAKDLPNQIPEPEFSQLPTASLSPKPDHHQQRRSNHDIVSVLVQIALEEAPMRLQPIKIRALSVRVRALSQAVYSIQKDVESAATSGATFIPVLRDILPWLWLDLVTLRGDLATAAFEIKAKADQHSAMLENRQMEIRDLAQQLRQLLDAEFTALAVLRAELMSRKEEVAMAQESVNQAESRISEATVALEDAQNAIDAVRNRISQLERLIAQANEVIRTGRATIERYSRRLSRPYTLCPNRYSYESCRHDARKKAWQRDRGSWREARQDARERVAGATRSRSTLNQEVLAKRESEKALTDELSQLEITLAKAESDYSQALKQYEEKRNQLWRWEREQRIELYDHAIQVDQNRVQSLLAQVAL